MNSLILYLVVVYCSTWLEYKFSRSYGDYFFDYSMNSRYGVNGGTAGSSKAISTDRGVYFNELSNIKIYNSAILPHSFTLTTWIMDIDSHFILFYNRANYNGMLFGRQTTYNRIRLEIGLADYYGNEWKFYSGKFK